MILYVEKSMPLNSKACDGAILQYQNPPCGIVKKFGWKLFYYSNIDHGHALWAFTLDDLRLWHMAQSKYVMCHITKFWKKNYKYLF